MNAPAVAAAPAIATQDLFVKVPQTTLPNGRVVPAFEVGQYLCSKGADGRAICRAIRDTGFKGYLAQEFTPAAPDPVGSLREAIRLCDV